MKFFLLFKLHFFIILQRIFTSTIVWKKLPIGYLISAVKGYVRVFTMQKSQKMRFLLFSGDFLHESAPNVYQFYSFEDTSD